MYHRVLTDKEIQNSFSNSGIIVNVDSFDKQIEYLAKYFNILNVNQVIENIENGKQFNTRSCLITFDDGWIDNYRNAYPILKAHRASSLIFLPFNYIGTGELFWQEQIVNYIYVICRYETEVPDILVKNNLSHIYNLQGNQLRKEINYFIGNLKKLSNEEIDNLVSKFKAHIEKSNYPTVGSVDEYIDWDHAHEMSRNNVWFGSHAMSHRLLTKLNNEELKIELKQSKVLLEGKLQLPIHSIAYPNGSFNETVVNATRIAGYNLGFTTNTGYFQTNENPFEIKRVNIHQNAARNIPLFLCRILGLF